MRAIAKSGGDDRIRTCDILLAKQALYQLSYVPVAALEGWPRTADSPLGERGRFRPIAEDSGAAA